MSLLPGCHEPSRVFCFVVVDFISTLYLYLLPRADYIYAISFLCLSINESINNTQRNGNCVIKLNRRLLSSNYYTK